MEGRIAAMQLGFGSNLLVLRYTRGLPTFLSVVADMIYCTANVFSSEASYVLGLAVSYLIPENLGYYSPPSSPGSDACELFSPLTSGHVPVSESTISSRCVGIEWKESNCSSQSMHAVHVMECYKRNIASTSCRR